MLVENAGSTSFNGLMKDIKAWIDNNEEASRLVPGGILDPFLGRRLLLEVSLSGGFDIKEKLHGLVETYGTDVNFDGDVGACNKSVENIVSPRSARTKLRGVLALAVSENQLESVGVLLSLKADANARYDLWGGNTFVSAAKNNRTAIVKLLYRHGANLWQTDPMGYTSMERAIQQGNVDLVDFFLKEGFLPDWYRVENRMTLLHYAVENRTKEGTEVVRLLIAAGANPHARCFGPGTHEQDVVADGYTPLQYLRNSRLSHVFWHEYNNEELRRERMHHCIANESILVDKMQANVEETTLAVCMSTHSRLGSDATCSLSGLAGEPALLQMIMQDVCQQYDAAYPSAPVSPWEVYMVL